MTESRDRGVYWGEQTVQALEEATRAFIAGVLEDSNIVAIHEKRGEVMEKDLELAIKLREERAKQMNPLVRPPKPI